jgi:hypothetical protein
MLIHDVAVVFLAGAAEGFEGDHEEDDTDAGSREHAFGGIAPRLGNEAYDCVSIGLTPSSEFV